MTQLLVSVRSAEEAHTALAAGVDLIDVKEPARGSLGAASPHVVAEVVRAVAGRVPVSAALGELIEPAGRGDARERAAALDAGVRFAKLGLAGCALLPDWPTRWAEALAALPAGVGSVAVVYADGRAANSPPPELVLVEARRLGCRGVLVDTFDKRGGGLFEHWPAPRLRRFVEEARRHGLLAVLAGSLDRDAVRWAVPLRPDYVAVRGAACRGLREGHLDAERTAELAALVAAESDRPLRGAPRPKANVRLKAVVDLRQG